MTVIYLGSRTVGESVPGLSDALSATGEGLRNMRSAADLAIGQIGVATGLLTSALGDLESAKDGLTAEALGPLNSAFGQANALLSQLQSLLDPNAYLSNVVLGLDDLLTALGLTSGAAYVAQQIAGVTAGVASIQSQINGMVSELDDMTNGMTYLGDALAKIGEVTSALTAANAATLGALVVYTEMLSGLANSGVHAFGYTGAISALGSELDAATPASGVFGPATIGGVILFAETADATTLAVLEDIFGL